MKEKRRSVCENASQKKKKNCLLSFPQEFSVLLGKKGKEGVMCKKKKGNGNACS